MAMLANFGTEFTGPWYPDSGSTHHVTSSAANLTHQMDSQSPEQIFMGNGYGLKIASIGSACFNSPIDTIITFTLSHLLYVPTITKNLVSVSRFC